MTLAFGHIKTSADLLAIARAMEERSAERYRELAEAFEVSCNPDTAEAFRELAETEDRHAAEFPSPPAPTALRLPWDEQDPEIADPDAVHYLMLPWHAFDLAIRHEERAHEFFDSLAMAASTPEVRAAARTLAEREKTHIQLVRARRDSFPEPHPGWDEDEDPPNWDM